MKCQDKKAYATKAIAIQHRSACLKARGIELFVYKCQKSKKWHLTKWQWESAA